MENKRFTVEAEQRVTVQMIHPEGAELTQGAVVELLGAGRGRKIVLKLDSGSEILIRL